MAYKKSITLRMLAEELGLTIQTISKALRGLPGMSEETRQGVVRKAAERGYRTKDQIQQLTQERIAPYPHAHRRFLLVQSEQSLPFHKLLMRGLNRRFTEFGHRIETLLLPVRMEPKRFEDWVQDHEVAYSDGIFITPRIVPDFTEDMLLRLPVNRMLLNYPPQESKVDSVVWDVDLAVHQAVGHLVRQGHREVMYVGDIESQRGFQLRWTAFQAAIREHGLPWNPSEHGTGPRTDSGAWLQEVRDKFAAHRPTAVLCGVDEESGPVYTALQAMGCRIPEQLSMIAFLNEQTPQLPLFTRPALLIEEAGYRAADRMLWRIANPSSPYEHVRIQGEWLAGNTVAKPDRYRGS